MTITEAVSQFLADLETEGRSPHTVAAYGRDLDTFESFAGRMEIDAGDRNSNRIVPPPDSPDRI